MKGRLSWSLEQCLSFSPGCDPGRPALAPCAPARRARRRCHRCRVRRGGPRRLRPAAVTAAGCRRRELPYTQIHRVLLRLTPSGRVHTVAAVVAAVAVAAVAVGRPAGRGGRSKAPAATAGRSPRTLALPASVVPALPRTFHSGLRTAGQNEISILLKGRGLQRGLRRTGRGDDAAEELLLLDEAGPRREPRRHCRRAIRMLRSRSGLFPPPLLGMHDRCFSESKKAVAQTRPYQAMPRIPGFFGTLNPGPNPYLLMASVYRQGIPNPYSLRSHSGRFPLK